MIQELYQSVKKIEPNSLAEEKGLIAELKSKMKNFKDSKDHLYLLYRKDL